MGSSKMRLFVRGVHPTAKMPVFCNGKIVKQTADQPDEFETQIGQTLLDLEINSELKTQLRELSITGAKLEKGKNEFYNLETVLLLTPNCVIAWLEAFACENYLRPIGGHAIYDVAIPLTNIAYFCILYGHRQMGKKID